MYQNNDYELLEQVKDGSEQSINTLYKKYEPLINSIAIRYQSYLPNVGLEISDLLQEGRLGLMKAINQYDRNRDILFYSYAKTCIETRIFSAITATRRQKHRILNESLSLEDKENDMISLEEVLFNEGDNPESQILSIEKINDLIYKMHNLLTPMESQVFEL